MHREYEWPIKGVPGIKQQKFEVAVEAASALGEEETNFLERITR